MNTPDPKAVETVLGNGYQQDKEDPTKFWKSDNGIIRTAEVKGTWITDNENPNGKEV